MTRVRVLRLVALVCGLALVATACGDDDGDGATTTVAPTTEASAAEETTDDGGAGDEAAPTTGGTEEVDPATGPSGTLRIGHLPPVATWDPHQESRAVIMSFYDTVYDSLLRYDADLQVQPGLAESWELSPDALVLTLREGVVFHDGTPFDAEAAVFNLERARTTPGLSALTLAKVTAVEAVDARTVRLDLGQPAPELLLGLTRSPGLMVSPAAAEAGTIGQAPVGTGPYAFNADESDGVTYVFDAFADFYDPAQQGFERVVHLALNDAAARLNAFQAGELDIAFVGGPELGAYEGAGAETVRFEQVASALYFFDQGPGGVFEDPRVRQALSHAIDRATLAEVAGPAEPRIARYAEGELGYSADATGFPHDPDRAAELLAEAGASDLEFSVPSFAQFDLANQVVQGMLAEVGVTMNIEQVPVGSLESECISGAWVACLLPVDNLHPADLYRSSVAANGFRNPNGVEHPEVDAAAAAAFAATDDAAAAEAWGEVTAAMTEALPFTSLTMSFGTIGFPPDTLTDPQPIRFVAGSVDLRALRFVEG